MAWMRAQAIAISCAQGQVAAIRSPSRSADRAHEGRWDILADNELLGGVAGRLAVGSRDGRGPRSGGGGGPVWPR